MRLRSLLRRSTLAALLCVLASCALIETERPALELRAGDGNGPAKLTAKVVFERAPVVGATVTFFEDVGGKPAPTPFTVAGPSDDKGEVVVTLASGRYFVVAEKRGQDGRVRFHGWFGGNPLSLDGGDHAYLVFNTVDLEQSVSLDITAEARLPGSGVMGVVADPLGQPVEGAYVYAYLTPKKGFRDRPYELSARTSAEGFFSLALPPGHYYLLARWRRSGGFAGPMGVGDRFGFEASNPYEIPQHGYARLAFRIAEILDPEVVAKAASEAASEGRAPTEPIDPTARMIGPASAFTAATKSDGIIRGTIRDAYGKPVAGFHATLYENPDFLWQPTAMSAPTRADGRFALIVSEPGVYHVGARNYYGRQLEFGDFYGFYQGPDGARVSVASGEVIDDVEIHVAEYRFD